MRKRLTKKEKERNRRIRELDRKIMLKHLEIMELDNRLHGMYQ